MSNLVAVILLLVAGVLIGVAATVTLRGLLCGVEDYAAEGYHADE